jgi:hypothetical protein
LSSSLVPPVAKADGVIVPPDDANVSTPDFHSPVFDSPNNPRHFPNDVPPLPLSSGCGNPACTHDHSMPLVPALRKDEKIQAVFMQGVITDQRRRRSGQSLMIDGVEEILKACNVRAGIVQFESGKVVTVPK